MVDPYKVLGVGREATQDEIKKSYRKLAKLNHPDLNPGNKEAEARFKEISHAHDLIGTEEARANFLKAEQEEKLHEEYAQSQRNRGESFHRTQQNGGRYSQHFSDQDIDPDFFESLFGSRSRGSADRPGQSVNYTLEVSFKEAALGGEKILTLPDGKKINVKIPAGIESGKKLRFKGLGTPGIGKGAPGDAYIEIHVAPLNGFTRQGDDIETELAISFFEALLGQEIQVKTLDGEVMLKIPAGVTSGTKLRIKGKGAGAEGKRGNQLVKLIVMTPKNVDPELAAQMNTLKEKFNYNPRLSQ